MTKFDVVDKKILEILQESGRITNYDLSQKIGMSPSATSERVKRLEDDGVIDKYVAMLNKAKIEREVTALIFVQIVAHQSDPIQQFVKSLDGLEEIMECHHVSGDADFMLKVAVKDIPAYEDFLLNKLTKVQGISKLNTSFVLNTYKFSTKYPI